ncbi:response regulator transcription factor [Paenibacillus sp. GSMTC-2017]|uniref:response regulator transcription factor n=1 Tax=Paenibacillus sp. GSMTC-2017 TaxID=2794350 RepID=UPI0018D65571|nr:response regulator transcription factor [Paenibacillus sp. GSMTC-2017]MBH5319216.1 response regulator transcription factor [Paenibacillus sp. GSMTC-2017]
MYRIFIIEDDIKIATILKNKMEQYGYISQAATQFQELMPEIEAFDPQLVLLDINLPYFDGYYWCRQIRTRSSVPIIFISARSGEMDQVMAIENGGDDYITKPIQLELLMAKVRGSLRRSYGEYAPAISATDFPDGAGNENRQDSSELAVQGLRLYMSRNELEWDKRRVELTKNEGLLAECLLRKPGQIISREQLLEALWDDVQFVDDNTLTVNVTRLRKKLEELGLPKIIETIRGQGYKLSTYPLGEGED